MGTDSNVNENCVFLVVLKFSRVVWTLLRLVGGVLNLTEARPSVLLKTLLAPVPAGLAALQHL